MNRQERRRQERAGRKRNDGQPLMVAWVCDDPACLDHLDDDLGDDDGPLDGCECWGCEMERAIDRQLAGRGESDS